MRTVHAPLTGNIWKIQVQSGNEVNSGHTLIIMESMKMEIPIEVEDDGVVHEVHVKEGQAVSEGQALVTIKLR